METFFLQVLYNTIAKRIFTNTYTSNLKKKNQLKF